MLAKLLNSVPLCKEFLHTYVLTSICIIPSEALTSLYIGRFHKPQNNIHITSVIKYGGKLYFTFRIQLIRNVNVNVTCKLKLIFESIFFRKLGKMLKLEIYI